MSFDLKQAIQKGNNQRLDPYICPECDSQVKKRIDWSSKTEQWECKNPDCDYSLEVDISKK